MSSNGSGATWLSLHDDKKRDIENVLGKDYRVTAEVNSSRSFRDALEIFCKKRGELKPSRLEARAFPSYRQIIELAKAVGNSAADLHQLAPTDSLESLVWRISFAVIECGHKAKARLSPLVTLIVKLNNTVPSFSANGGEFQPNVDPSEEKALQTSIAETASRIEEARGMYDVMVTQVADDEERKKTDLEQPSLHAKRNMPDIVHQNSTSTREVQVRFVSEKFLGRGSYGDVDEVRELTTGASYARKHIHLNIDKSPEEVAKEVKKEVAIMQKLRHLHIATVLFYFKEEMAYSIIMLPVAEYDLRGFLSLCTQKDYSPACTKVIYPWFGCLLDALAYAHKLKIKHQDIKPSNILIKHDQPYLCDFGLAKDFSEMDTSSSRGHEVQGTFVYRAPEVMPNRNRGRKADVFALGCVYSEMFTVTQGKSVEEYRDARHEAGSTAFRECLPTVEAWLRKFECKGLSALLVDQILSMIDKNVDERHTAEQAVNFLKRERALFCVE